MLRRRNTQHDDGNQADKCLVGGSTLLENKYLF